MPSDYAAIRDDNIRRYGTDIARYGPMLLADRYDDRTHFLFELLQNAEDALAKRECWTGSRVVSLHLSKDLLRVSHQGLPFDELDVRGVCGIAESTKGLTAIGRFGIGFKSVYAYTDRPEIHSGNEDFAIKNFVWPVATDSIDKGDDETVILIPFKQDSGYAVGEISAGFKNLRTSALLFLRNIEEIEWVIEEGSSGVYLRQSVEVASGVRRVKVIGQETDQDEVEEDWLIFSEATTDQGHGFSGTVELAFRTSVSEGGTSQGRIVRTERSPLVVFFPTVLETHLGFLVQGPYRSTPSRDNVPQGDEWNRYLVGQTASLLCKSLRWLRDNELLDTDALRCLPLDSTKFPEGGMFRPLFDATKEAFKAEHLLPSHDGDRVSAKSARLGRTRELRELFSPTQLAAIYGEEAELHWLSGDITLDRTPELRRYLIQELDVPELVPEAVIPRLGKEFLEKQNDDWLVRLYEFLAGQPSLRSRAEIVPLVRLEHGGHVVAFINGQPQAFLPTSVATDFPIVRRSVCRSKAALLFLESLGLTKPDPVDDVIRNVLPKYQKKDIVLDNAEYQGDINRILRAFETDSKSRREKLTTALTQTPFVKAIGVGNESRFLRPDSVYLATERLKALFSGVAGVYLVDDRIGCLKGEPIREMLESCGATRHLQPIQTSTTLTLQEKSEIRCSAGLLRATNESAITDYTLRGLDELFKTLPALGDGQRRERAGILWEALADLESRRGSRVFSVDYVWSYSHETRRVLLDAAFVRELNHSAWVPSGDARLDVPALVPFDSLGWRANLILQSKIRFKPPIIEELAREAGIEPGVLDLLRRMGVTSEAELRNRLGVSATDLTEIQPEVEGAEEPTTEISRLNVQNLPGPDNVPSRASRDGEGHTGDSAAEMAVGHEKPASSGSAKSAKSERSDSNDGSKESAKSRGPRFVSYIAVDTDDEEIEPNGLDTAARLALEETAIAFILTREPEWQRTPTNNPGFDLKQSSEVGRPIRWCEVKAMRGTLSHRPVGLSKAQFEFALSKRDAYWLYVVEKTGTEDARIVRIQDPAGKAQTFLFDAGWLGVAETDK